MFVPSFVRLFIIYLFIYLISSYLFHQVIGVPDERLGEQVAAWIRLRDQNDTVTAQEIKKFCKGKVRIYFCFGVSVVCDSVTVAKADGENLSLFRVSTCLQGHR